MCKWPLAREAPKNFGIPYFSTTAWARDFKFGTPLGFAKAHHKTTLRGKVSVALGYKNYHIFGVPL